MTTVHLPPYHDNDEARNGGQEQEEEEEDALLPRPANSRRESAPRQTAMSRRRPQTPPWMYPIQVSAYVLEGIFYLFANPVLFKVIGPRVIPCIILSFAIIFILFFFLYIPHVALLVFFHGKWAFVQAVFMILNESALLISILCENFLLEESLVNMFDAVLLLKGYQELAEQGQEVDALASNVVESLGKYKRSPNLRASFQVICEYIVFLPTNFIPWIGPFIFLAIQGNRAGPIAHYWYFRLKDWDKKKRKEFVKKNHAGYLGFGTVALGLQFVPVASILVAFTNAIGAALWAIKMEEREARRRILQENGV